jgi:hypothetical protein
MKAAVIFPVDYLQHNIIYVQKYIILITFISRDYISLRAPCQIVADRSAWFAQSITLSLKYDVHSNFICMTYNTSLLLSTL